MLRKSVGQGCFHNLEVVDWWCELAINQAWGSYEWQTIVGVEGWLSFSADVGQEVKDVAFLCRAEDWQHAAVQDVDQAGIMGSCKEDVWGGGGRRF